MWNRHRMFITHIGIPKHKKSLRLLSSGTKLFITIELKEIRHKEGDTQSFYADFSNCPPPPPPRAAPRCKLLVWSRRAPKVNRLPRTLKLNSTDFSQNPQNPPCTLPVHDVIHIPWSYFSIWDFYFDISEWHILPARVWTPALMLHLTYPCAKRKVLSLTKPKGKIYKTTSLGHYITDGLDPSFHLLFSRIFGIIPKAPTIFVIVIFMFLSFFNSRARSCYLSIFSLCFIFILWAVWNGKWQVLVYTKTDLLLDPFVYIKVSIEILSSHFLRQILIWANVIYQHIQILTFYKIPVDDHHLPVIPPHILL